MGPQQSQAAGEQRAAPVPAVTPFPCPSAMDRVVLADLQPGVLRVSCHNPAVTTERALILLSPASRGDECLTTMLGEGTALQGDLANPSWAGGSREKGFRGWLSASIRSDHHPLFQG